MVFTDVEGSTDLRSRLGDDATQAMLRAHAKLVRARLEERGGREIKALGDGFLVAFASARRALAFAVSLQQAVDQDGRLRVRGGAPLCCRGAGTNDGCAFGSS